MNVNGKLKTVLAVVVAATAMGGVAMPSRAQFQKAMPLVKEMSQGDEEAVKAKKMTPREAADRALSRAGDTSMDEAVRYLFLESAVNFYVKAAEYDRAASVVHTLKAEIKDVSDADIVELLERNLRKVKREHAGQLYELLQDARTREEAAAKIVRYRNAVKKDSKDAISQARLAYCNVLLDNWEEALKAFAKSDGKVAEFAKAELDKSKSALDIGNFWWGYAVNDYDFRTRTEQLTEAFQAHARDCYRNALKGSELTGVRRELIEQRVGYKVPMAAPAAKDRLSKLVVKEMVSSVKTDAGTMLRTKTYNFGGVDMEFIECPAGTFTMGAGPEMWKSGAVTRFGNKRNNTNMLYPRKVTISRPFWMAKYPVTAELWTKLEGDLGYKGDAAAAAKALGPKMAVYSRRSTTTSLFDKINGLLKGKLPQGYVARLPTAAELEYAFRSGGYDYGDGYSRVFTKGPSRMGNHSEVVDKPKDLVEWLAKNGVNVADMIASDDRSYVKYDSKAHWANIGGVVGAHKANVWGFHDLFMDTCCLDKVVGKSILQPGDNRKPDSDFCSFHAYPDEEIDPYVNDGQRLVYFSPITYPWLFKGGGRTTIRIVIGPDLEKEKGSQKK